MNNVPSFNLYTPLLKRCGLWLLWAAIAAGCQPDAPPKMPPLRTVSPVPANPNLNTTARRLLTRLCYIYGTTTLTGQVEYKIQDRYAAFEYIEQLSGRKPTVLSFDLIDYSPSRIQKGADPGKLIYDAIDKVKNHQVVLSLYWHWNAPLHLIDNAKYPWQQGYYTAATQFNLQYALSHPDSPDYQALINDIDAMAHLLKLLQIRDIPVLWRPLHQAEGRWFWWGGQGAAAFKALWQLMYDRLTHHHQLNNLIWVYTGENPQWYPGDDRVDIVGMDTYPADASESLTERWISLVKQHNGNKIIALTEFGGVPDIENLQKQGVWFSYFVSWTDQTRSKLGPMSLDPRYVQHQYQSTTVVTLDEWVAPPSTSPNTP